MLKSSGAALLQCVYKHHLQKSCQHSQMLPQHHCSRVNVTQVAQLPAGRQDATECGIWLTVGHRFLTDFVTTVRFLQAGRAYAALLQDQSHCSDNAAAARASHDFFSYWRRGADAGPDRYHVQCTQAQINEAVLHMPPGCLIACQLHVEAGSNAAWQEQD